MQPRRTRTGSFKNKMMALFKPHQETIEDVVPEPGGNALSILNKALESLIKDPLPDTLKLGEGAYGIVYKTLHVSDGKDIAAKIVHIDKIIETKYKQEDRAIKRQELIQECESEAAIMETLETMDDKEARQLIIHFFGSLMQDGCFVFAMAKMPNGSLESMIVLANSDKKEDSLGLRLRDLGIRLQIMVDVLKAINYIHSKEIIHRDIKPDNILLCENFHAVLADFGSACKFDRAQAIKHIGTPPFMSPELIASKLASPKSDIYAAGITAYLLAELKNDPHPEIENAPALFAARQAGVLPAMPQKGDKPKFNLLVDLFAKATQKDPAQRPTALEMLDYIENTDSQGNQKVAMR